MRLPRDLLSGTYTKPRIFLCEVNKERVCQLDTSNTSGSFKFNSYSELSFEVGRVYNNTITGDIVVNPHYDKIEALRLIELEGVGYFEIQGPELVGDGIKETKQITAYSLEYTLSQKYLENFLINTGAIGSVEVTYAEDVAKNIDNIVPVTFYNPSNKDLSLLHLILVKAYGWKIGYVDPALATLSRTFEVDRESIYDFIMNEICDKFNCYVVFDTINNTINFYAESLTQKFMGDGHTREFIISPPFVQLGTVSIGGYKTTKYKYTASTGRLELDDVPEDNSVIEVTDGALSAWETDVFITFENLSQEINVNYDADEIKTVLTITGADDLGIHEVNMGLPYIVDLSYYCTPDWLGPDLYKAYTQYLKDYNAWQLIYEENSQKINNLNKDILWLQNRMTSEDIEIVVKQQNVTSTTVGQYFVRAGDAPNYYYTEVSLPDDYNAGQVYYLFESEGINLTESDVTELYEALQNYFTSYFVKKESDTSDLKNLEGLFSFVASEYNHMLAQLDSVAKFLDTNTVSKQQVESKADSDFVFACVNRFLDIIWNQFGSFPLTWCYKPAYTELQTVAMEAGWGNVENENYGRYLAVYLLIKSIERAIAVREMEIQKLKNEQATYQKTNTQIGAELDLHTYFQKNYADRAEQFMMRLSAFLREDEYVDDNFIQTGQETLEELYRTKQELKECGKIELNALCQPKLQFSMSMSNIYALPEFEPIVEQFQLGRVIKVGLRPDYIKQSRLLQVDINFDDFADFSCEFGELTNLKTQSDIHADLLSQAISAGKSVASNASYWNKGTDQANSIDLRIQRGLLDAATSIKSMDGHQGVEIDNYGIHLRKADPSSGENDPEQGWITNNKFLYSNDGFKTVNSVFGKYSIDGEDYWGLLAKAVIAGHIEGSKIKGGTIQIGEYVDDNGATRYAFEVHKDGTVTMGGGGHTIDGYATTNIVQQIQGQVDDINSNKMYRVEITTEAPTIISKNTDKATMVCRVFSWDSDITDDLDASLFMWKRVSTDSGADTIWNAMPEHQGVKSITIDADDVIENSSFTCEVNLPE